MYKFALIYTAALLGPLFMLAGSQAGAVTHPYEFHADAKMLIVDQGPVERAYGYMNVSTDPGGDGEINVMFSNASRVNEAEFNARVRFLDRAGATIREESFNCRIDATGIEGPVECKVSKPLTLTDFDSIEVDFFLTEFSGKN